MRPAISSLLLISGVLTSQMACVKPAPRALVYRLGDKVQVGPLVYTIIDATWWAQLGEGAQARMPSRRFLIVRLSVTNGGSEPLSIPALRLADDTGAVYSESMDGQNVPSWLGLIRKLKPVDTIEGNILFDVDAKSYKLKLDDDTNPDHVAMVEMPLRFGLERPY
jgi:hypothetical protein